MRPVYFLVASAVTALLIVFLSGSGDEKLRAENGVPTPTPVPSVEPGYSERVDLTQPVSPKGGLSQTRTAPLSGVAGSRTIKIIGLPAIIAEQIPVIWFSKSLRLQESFTGGIPLDSLRQSSSPSPELDSALVKYGGSWFGPILVPVTSTPSRIDFSEFSKIALSNQSGFACQVEAKTTVDEMSISVTFDVDPTFTICSAPSVDRTTLSILADKLVFHADDQHFDRIDAKSVAVRPTTQVSDHEIKRLEIAEFEGRLTFLDATDFSRVDGAGQCIVERWANGRWMTLSIRQIEVPHGEWKVLPYESDAGSMGDPIRTIFKIIGYKNVTSEGLPQQISTRDPLYLDHSRRRRLQLVNAVGDPFQASLYVMPPGSRHWIWSGVPNETGLTGEFDWDSGDLNVRVVDNANGPMGAAIYETVGTASAIDLESLETVRVVIEIRSGSIAISGCPPNGPVLCALDLSGAIFSASDEGDSRQVISGLVDGPYAIETVAAAATFGDGLLYRVPSSLNHYVDAENSVIEVPWSAEWGDDGGGLFSVDPSFVDSKRLLILPIYRPSATYIRLRSKPVTATFGPSLRIEEGAPMPPFALVCSAIDPLPGQFSHHSPARFAVHGVVSENAPLTPRLTQYNFSWAGSADLEKPVKVRVKFHESDAMLERGLQFAGSGAPFALTTWNTSGPLSWKIPSEQRATVEFSQAAEKWTIQLPTGTNPTVEIAVGTP